MRQPSPTTAVAATNTFWPSTQRGADPRARHHVAEVPDLGAGADARAAVDDRRRVRPESLHAASNDARSRPARGRVDPRGDRLRRPAAASIARPPPARARRRPRARRCRRAASPRATRATKSRHCAAQRVAALDRHDRRRRACGVHSAKRLVGRRPARRTSASPPVPAMVMSRRLSRREAGDVDVRRPRRRRNAASPTRRCPPAARPQAPPVALTVVGKRAEQVQRQRDVVGRQRPPGAARAARRAGRRASRRERERLAQQARRDDLPRPPDRRVVQQQVPDREHAGRAPPPPREARPRRAPTAPAASRRTGACRRRAPAGRPRGGAAGSTATTTAATSGSRSASSRSAVSRASGWAAPARARRSSSSSQIQRSWTCGSLAKAPRQRQAPRARADHGDSDGTAWGESIRYRRRVDPPMNRLTCGRWRSVRPRRAIASLALAVGCAAAPPPATARRARGDHGLRRRARDGHDGVPDADATRASSASSSPTASTSPLRLRFQAEAAGQLEITIYDSTILETPGEPLHKVTRDLAPEDLSNGKDGRWVVEDLVEMKPVKGVIWVGVHKIGGTPTIWASSVVSGQAFVRNNDPTEPDGPAADEAHADAAPRDRAVATRSASRPRHRRPGRSAGGRSPRGRTAASGARTARAGVGERRLRRSTRPFNDQPSRPRRFT